MLVSAVALLQEDGTAMGSAVCIQKKAPLIADKAMIEIIKVSSSSSVICCVHATKLTY